MYPYTAAAMDRNDSMEDLFEMSGVSNTETPAVTPSSSFGPQFLGGSPGMSSPGMATSPMSAGRRKGSFLDRLGRSMEQGTARYDLTGVVVHSGQASAGHYYAYIKERRYRHRQQADLTI